METDFLQLRGKTILVTGVANRRSIAWSVAKVLEEAGARLVFLFRSPELRDKNLALLGKENAETCVCDVEDEAQVAGLAPWAAENSLVFDGILHSIAFANYSEGIRPFHEVKKRDFLQAMDISCFSLAALCNALKANLAENASIVTLSISSTKMAAESYGYMGPVKAALDSSVVFLAKSLTSQVSPHIRVNAVGASPLKTSASAGIPGYIDAYLFAEKATLRHQALETSEAANVAAFLLSPRSSGINAQTIVVDAGMSCNYFDSDIIHTQQL